MNTTPWPRTSLPPKTSGGPVTFSLVCAASEPLDLSNGSPAAVHGWSTSSPLRQTVDITIDKAPWQSELGQWLKTFQWTEATCPGPLQPAIQNMTLAYFVDVNEPDLSDLGALQDAWACVHWLISLGATAVLDRTAERWISPEDIFGWGESRRFNIENDVAFIHLDHPSFEFVVSRGMTKFCRPDVLLHMPRDLPQPLLHNGRHLLRQLCQRMAMGEVIEPNTTVNSGILSADVLAFRPERMTLPFELANGSLVVIPALPEEPPVVAPKKPSWWQRLTGR